MTMQSNNPKSSGFLQTVAGQTIIGVIVIAIVLLLAWRYVF